MRQTAQFLTNFDFLGNQIGLEHNKSTQFKSLAGGVYSLIIFVITSVIGIMFSREIYERKDPTVVQSKEAVAISKVSLLDFPIAFLSSLNNKASDIPFKYLIGDLVSVYVHENTTLDRQVYTDVFERCNLTNMNFPDSNRTRDLFNFTQYPGSYCIKDPGRFFFQNPYSSANSSFLNFRFRKCTKKEVPDCPDNINEILPAIFVGLYYINSYVDSTNYESPVYYKVDSLNNQMTGGLLKRYYLRIANNRYTTDNGFILETIKEYNFFNFDSTNLDFTTESQTYLNHIYWITLESPSLISKYKRTYNKIQYFLANVGGFASIVKIVIYILTKKHLRFKYIEFIRDLILKPHNSSIYSDKLKSYMRKPTVIKAEESSVQAITTHVNKQQNNLISASIKKDGIVEKESLSYNLANLEAKRVVQTSMAKNNFIESSVRN